MNKVTNINNVTTSKFIPFENTSFNFTICPKEKLSLLKVSKDRFKSFSSIINSQEINNSQNVSMIARESYTKKEQDYESGLKPLQSDRNKYTMSIPFIQNKEMMLLHKHKYENGYEFDRLGKADFNKFNTLHLPKYTFPKNRRFWNHKPIQKECFSYTNIHCQRNTLDNNESHNHKMFHSNSNNNSNSNSEVRIKKQYKAFRNKFHKKLMLCIGICNKNIKKDFGMRMIKKLEDEPIDNNKRNRYSLNNSITNILDLNKKDHIPIIYPKATTLVSTKMSLGEKNRYDKILNELLKVKYAISINKGLEKKIIIELLIKHGLYSDNHIKDYHFNNFLMFLQEDIIKFDSTKSLKEILIKAMKYTPNDLNLNLNTKNEKISVGVQCDNNNTNNKSLLIKDHKIKGSTVFEMYNKIPLAKQKQFKEISLDKNMQSVMKDLEDELNHLTEAKWNRNKSTIMKSPTAFHLTQSNSQTNYQDDIQLLLTNYVPIDNNRIKERENNGNQLIKGLKKSLSEINERMYYSKLNKQQLDLKEIKLKKKFTEFIMLERFKRKLVLNNLYNNNLSIDESINGK